MNDRSDPRDAFLRFRATGDPAALAEVFDKAAPDLLRVGIHLCGDAATAEDLVQGTFLAAVEGAETYDDARPLMPWLVGILTNGARMATAARVARSTPISSSSVEAPTDGGCAREGARRFVFDHLTPGSYTVFAPRVTTQDSFTAVAGASLFVESVLPADDGSLSHAPRSSMVKTGQDGSFDLRVPRAPRYRARGYDYTSRTNLFQDEWEETAGAQEIARDFVVR